MNRVLSTINHPFLITLLLTLSLLWPLFVAPYFTHHDDVQVIRLHQMDKCIKDYQIPCRWVPDLGGLYGYPIFNYYAPLSYYYGEIFYLLTGSLLISVKVMFITAFLGSFIFMYLWAKKFWGELGGSLSALFYSFAPYHALDFYVRGAMGEMWALMAFPAILWSLTRLSEKKSIGNVLLLTLSLSLLLLSHNLSTMVFIPLVAVFSAILFFQRKSKFFIWLTLSALILSVTLSSFYLIPLVVEKNLVHVETTTYGYFHYTEHFKGFKKLLDRSWGWGASVREVPGGEKDGISFQIGWVHLVGWLLALYVAYRLWRKNRFLSAGIITLSMIIIFSIFMINPRSEFIWKMIPPLEYLQFPWRFLLLITFLISFLSGAIFAISKDKRIWWAGVLLVTLLNFTYFRPGKFIYTNDKELLTGSNWEKQIMRSIYDYLPIYAKEPPAHLADSQYEILTGEAEVRNFNKGTNWINFDIEVKRHTIIRLSQYYFPDWTVKVNGEPTTIEYENNNFGLITFILGEGQYRVDARLYDTPIRIISNWITILGFIVIAILFFLQFKQVQNWIRYYLKRIG